MAITKKYPPISHIAQLANLNLSSSQLEAYQESFISIMDQMEELNQIDLTSVDATSQVIEEQNVWREDQVIDSFSQDEALKNASRKHEGYFVVNSIFDRDE